MVPVLLCFVLLLVLILYYYKKKHGYWKRKGVPFEQPLPVVGNLLDTLLLREMIGITIKKIYDRHIIPYIGFYLLEEPALLIRDPEIVKNILVKDFNYFTDRTTVSDVNVDPVSAHILFNSKNPQWAELRKKVTPIFTSGKLKNMYGLIYEDSNNLIDYLKTNDSIVETRDIFAKFTTDVISSTGFGIRANSLKDPNAEFRRVSKKLFDWSSFEVSMPFLLYFLTPKLVKTFKISFFDKYCVDFLKKAFWSTISEREATQTSRNDFVDLLINLRNSEKVTDTFKLDDDMIIAQAIQFFTAGFETTSTTITFCLYELAKHPEKQKKLKEEIKATFARDQQFAYDDFKNMKYLDMCVNETLRKYPVLPFLDRRCKENYKIPNSNLVLEKGSLVYISVMGLHYDSQHFPEPENFYPERWEKPETPFTYLPFGDGPRNCIGSRFGLLTTKLGIARVLNDFTVELCEKSPENLIFETRGILLAPVNGLYLKITKD